MQQLYTSDESLLWVVMARLDLRQMHLQFMSVTVVDNTLKRYNNSWTNLFTHKMYKDKNTSYMLSLQHLCNVNNIVSSEKKTWVI